MSDLPATAKVYVTMTAEQAANLLRLTAEGIAARSRDWDAFEAVAKRMLIATFDAGMDFDPDATDYDHPHFNYTE